MIQGTVLDLARRIQTLDDQLTAMYAMIRDMRETQTVAHDTIKELCARVAVLEVSAKADIVTTGRAAED